MPFSTKITGSTSVNASYAVYTALFVFGLETDYVGEKDREMGFETFCMPMKVIIPLHDAKRISCLPNLLFYGQEIDQDLFYSI